MNIVKIQKLWRGYIVRKNMSSLKDGMTKTIMNEMLDMHIHIFNKNKEWNKHLSVKKIRNANFPSEISENIVKYVLFKKYKIMCTWDSKPGDLQMVNLLLEVKAFSSNGPSSFGPTEGWDRIYFVDCTKYINKVFTVYEIKLSNNDEKWRSIKVSKSHTIGDMCDLGKRPRVSFAMIQNQLGNICNSIWSGHISSL